jgi:hypothetical protein
VVVNPALAYDGELVGTDEADVADERPLSCRALSPREDGGALTALPSSMEVSGVGVGVGPFVVVVIGEPKCRPEKCSRPGWWAMDW